MVFSFSYFTVAPLLLLLLGLFAFIQVDSTTTTFDESSELRECQRNGSSAQGETWLLHGNPAQCYLAGSQGPCPSDQVLLPRALNSSRGKCKLPTANSKDEEPKTSGAFDFQENNCSSEGQVYSDRLQRCVAKLGGGGALGFFQWLFGGSITRSCSNEYYRSYARRCQNNFRRY